MDRHSDHKYASYKLIGRLYCDKFKDVDSVYTQVDLRLDFYRYYGYEINYDKALDARHYGESLLREYPRMNYEILPKYFHKLEATNPGTKTKIQTKSGRDKFLYCCMALGASIVGYKFMRPVICVDGTFLKTRYKGVLLVASCQDFDRKIFPLAWAIVDSENKEAWSWFFDQLKEITTDSEEVSIISDRALSIPEAFKNVFKKAKHGFCIYHIQKNLRTHFSGRDGSSKFIPLAKEYSEASFKMCWDEINETLPEEKKLGSYLLDHEIPYWARCKFTGRRYNMMTSNNAESINSVLKISRKSNVIGLLERILVLTQDWFAKYGAEARSWKDLGYYLAPKHEE